MKKTTTKKKRNPPDATHRNIRALKKRVKKLEYILKCLNIPLGESIDQIIYDEFERMTRDK